MARPVKNKVSKLKAIYYRNGVREDDDVSYDGMEITSPTLATLIIEVRRRLEKQNTTPQEVVS